MSEKYLIEYQLTDGTPVTIECTDGLGIERISNSRTTPTVSFESTLNQIKPVANLLLGAFTELNNPTEVELEFGVKFSGKVGVIFASADSEANFVVKLKWAKK